MRKQKGIVSTTLAIIAIALITIGAIVVYVLKKPSTSVKPSSPKTEVQESTKQAVEGTGVYVNKKYGYQISYPKVLTFREYPDLATGAGFRPVGEQAVGGQNEVITINASRKMQNLALAEYAKIGASLEIQSYDKLKTIEKIQTESGLIGYKTTWIVHGPPIIPPVEPQKPSVSLPITYFDLPGAKEPSTVQVSLTDEKYLKEYEEMLKTFKLK